MSASPTTWGSSARSKKKTKSASGRRPESASTSTQMAVSALEAVRHQRHLRLGLLPSAGAALGQAREQPDGPRPGCFDHVVRTGPHAGGVAGRPAA